MQASANRDSELTLLARIIALRQTSFSAKRSQLPLAGSEVASPSETLIDNDGVSAWVAGVRTRGLALG
jgi:hypothetical protein